MAWLSVGVSNDDLCDKMLDLGLLEEGPILEAFRNTDRGDFVLEKDRADAYLDRPFKKGNIHISAPHMYATVLGGLELEQGLSFLNVGSGSGYLSCLVAYLIGSSGICHGIDINEDVVSHSRESTAKWLQRRINKQLENKQCDNSMDIDTGIWQAEKRLQLNTSVLQESVSFVHGNCFHLNAQSTTNYAKYDRIYVGAACPETHKIFFYNLLQINGILILPIIESSKMLKIKRISDYVFTTSTLSNVTFAPLINTNNVAEYLDASAKNMNMYHEQVFKELFEEDDMETVKSSRLSSKNSTSSSSTGSSKKSSPRSPFSSRSVSPGPGCKKRKIPTMVHNILSAEPESIVLQKTVTDHINTKMLTSPSARKKLFKRSTSNNSTTSSLTSTPSVPLQNCVNLPSIVWQPNKYRHLQYPETFRRAVLTILMCSRYSRSPIPSFNLSSTMSVCSASSSVHEVAVRSGVGGSIGGSSSHYTSSHIIYARYDSLPTQLWFHILSYCTRDWFQAPTTPLQVLSHELLAERQLHLVTRHKLEEAEAARREAERERDLYRAVMLRMSRKQGTGRVTTGVLSGTTHLLNHIFGDHPHVGFDTDEELEHEAEEEHEEEEPEEDDAEEEEMDEEDEEDLEEGEDIDAEEGDMDEEEENLLAEDDVDESEHEHQPHHLDGMLFTDDEADDEEDEEEEESQVGHVDVDSNNKVTSVNASTETVNGSHSSSTIATVVESEDVSITSPVSVHALPVNDDDMIPLAASIGATVAQTLEVVSRVEQSISPLLSNVTPSLVTSLTTIDETEELSPTTQSLLPTLLHRYADTMGNHSRQRGYSSGSFDRSCATSLESSSTAEAGYRLSLSSSLEEESGAYSFNSSALGFLCDSSRYSEASGDEHTVISSSASVSSSSTAPATRPVVHQYSKNIPIVTNSSSPPRHQNILFTKSNGSGRSSRVSTQNSGKGPTTPSVERDSDDDTSSEEEDLREDDSSLEDDGIDNFYWY